MDIKPIRLIPKISQTELPDTRIDKNQPRVPPLLKQPSGKWHFQKGQIILNGQNVNRLIEASLHQPAAFWSDLAHELNAFLNETIRRYSKKKKRKIGSKDDLEELDETGELGQIAALVEAYIAKIMRILKRKYDETTDGLSYTLDAHGQLILNGMNINSFIEMARNYPNKKALLFLKGLKNRISIILSNKTSNPNYDKIQEATLRLFIEIDQELKRIVEKDRLIENT